MADGPAGVLVVDDHALFRDGLVAVIGRWPEFDVVGCAADGEEGVRLAHTLHPDLVLMDVRMAGIGGVEAARQITAADPQVRVAMLTASRLGDDVYQALRGGAHGYLSKDEPAERLHVALLGLMRGETALSSTIAGQVLAELGAPGRATPSSPEWLTQRERQVLRLLVDGRSNEEIGRMLFLSEATVKKYLGSITSKLHVKNRVQAAVYGLREGIVE